MPVMVAGLPFVLAADWNIEPEHMEAAIWPQVLRARVKYPEDPLGTFRASNGGSMLDYFLASEGIADLAQACGVYQEATTEPHKPSRLQMGMEARRLTRRVLERPAPFPMDPPIGPRRPVPAYPDVPEAFKA